MLLKEYQKRESRRRNTYGRQRKGEKNAGRCKSENETVYEPARKKHLKCGMNRVFVNAAMIVLL